MTICLEPFSRNVYALLVEHRQMLVQRRHYPEKLKGRDLYDLAHAQEAFDDLDADRIAMLFGRYLELSGQTISRAQAQERMLAKLANPRFLTDMRPLLPADAAERMTEAATADSFRRVFTTFVDRLPGEPWGRLSEIKERFGITW